MNFSKNTAAIAIASISAAMLAACGGGSGNTTAGISGTGYYAHGAVQRFGSIYVNGQEFQTSNADFVIEGQASAGQDDLIVGNVVEIQAEKQADGTLVASKVVFDAELKGPVASVDTVNKQFMVAGQTVQVSGTTVFEGTMQTPDFAFATLVQGNVVEVSGTIDGNGVLRASSVELEQQSAAGPVEVEVKGTVANRKRRAKTFTINDLTVDYAQVPQQGVQKDDGTFINVADGQFVEVSGTLTEGTLTATGLELEDRGPEIDEGETVEAEVEGIIISIDSATAFTLSSGLQVQHTPDTTVFEDNLSADALTQGTAVEVEGVLAGSGVLQAAKIEIDDDEKESPIEIAAQVSKVSEVNGQGSGSDHVTLHLFGTNGIEVIAPVEDTRITVDIEGVNRNGYTVKHINAGDYVEISAVRDSDDRLVATLIEVGELETNDAGQTEVELQARVTDTSQASGLINVRGVTVNVSNPDVEFKDADDSVITKTEFFKQVANGDLVEVNGTFNGNGINATEVELQPQTSAAPQ